VNAAIGEHLAEAVSGVIVAWRQIVFSIKPKNDADFGRAVCGSVQRAEREC